MIVTFSVNLGSVDARNLQLDPAQCREGMTLDVAEHIADQLGRRGIVLTGAPPADESVETAAADVVSYREKQKRKPKDE